MIGCGIKSGSLSSAASVTRTLPCPPLPINSCLSAAATAVATPATPPPPPAAIIKPEAVVAVASLVFSELLTLSLELNTASVRNLRLLLRRFSMRREQCNCNMVAAIQATNISDNDTPMTTLIVVDSWNDSS